MRSNRVHYVDAHGEHWGRIGETGFDQNWLRCVETDRGARHRASVESEFGPLTEVCTHCRRPGHQDSDHPLPKDHPQYDAFYDATDDELADMVSTADAPGRGATRPSLSEGGADRG